MNGASITDVGRGPAAGAAEVVVFDLDGVIRHWNDDELDAQAAGYGLPPRAILEVAFSEGLGRAAVTGALSYRQWMDRVRAEVIGTWGAAVEPALDRWEANVGVVDQAMVELLRSVRTQVPVALLSNGTTRLRRDLHVLGIAQEFDVVFNTAEIGVAKPDEAVFRHVISVLGTSPQRTAFIDDLPANTEGAAALGLPVHRFTGREDLTGFLVALGIEL